MSMTPENYAELKKRIQELVPEIMELKFGCIVNIEQPKNPYYVTVLRTLRSNKYTYNQHTKRKYYGMQDIFECMENFTVERHPIGEIQEILGRSIRLADVLLAIKNLKENRVGFFVNQYGMFYGMIGEKVDGVSDAEITVVYDNMGWSLTKDNLDYQSDETKQFLYDILIKN